MSDPNLKLNLSETIKSGFQSLFEKIDIFNEVEIRLLSPNFKRPAVDVFKFNRLIQVLRARYPMIEEDHLIVRDFFADSDDSDGGRLIIVGLEAIQAYCAAEPEKLQEFFDEYQVLRQTKTSVKTSHEDLIEKQFNLRLRVSQEQNDSTFIPSNDKKHYRYRKRYTFKVNESISFDLSVYKEATGPSFSRAKSTKGIYLLQSGEHYDIELDYTNIEGIDKNAFLQDQTFIECYTFALRLIYNTHRIIPNALIQEVKTAYKALRESMNIKKEFIGPDVLPLILAEVLPEESTGHQALELSNYLITAKTDGERALLFYHNKQFFLIDMNLDVIACDLSAKKSAEPLIFDVEVVDERRPTDFILPAQRKIWVFDFMIESKSYYQRDYTLIDRIEFVNKYLKTISVSEESSYSIQYKPYFDLSNKSDTASFIQYRNAKQFPTDGIILTHKNALKDIEATQFAYKIKNLNQLTIDFQYHKRDDQSFDLLVRDGPMARAFNPFIHPEYNKVVLSAEPPLMTFSDNPREKFLIVNDFVYESSFDSSHRHWIPIRVREIKTLRQKPNALKTAEGTWNMIINQVKSKYIDEKTKINIAELNEDNFIYYLQQWSASNTTSLSEWLKDNVDLPENYLGVPSQKSAKIDTMVKPLTQLHRQCIIGPLYQAVADKGKLNLLELASGRGADILRWNDSGFKKVVGIEIDNNQMTEAIRRKNEATRRKEFALKDIQFINASMVSDLTKIKNLSAKGTFDVVSCQFGITYAFATKESFTQFIKNVVYYLKSGGYFIGTAFEGKKVFKALKEHSGKHDFKIDDQIVWTIEFGSKKDNKVLKPFGHAVKSYLVSPYGTADEYLVDLTAPDVKAITDSHGLKLIKKSEFGATDNVQMFEEIYKTPMSSKCKELLKTVKATPQLLEYSQYNCVFVYQKR